MLQKMPLDDDNFFDLLSRYQSRRIDDQRCSFRLTGGANSCSSEANKENTEPEIGKIMVYSNCQCVGFLKVQNPGNIVRNRKYICSHIISVIFPADSRVCCYGSAFQIIFEKKHPLMFIRTHF